MMQTEEKSSRKQPRESKPVIRHSARAGSRCQPRANRVATSARPRFALPAAVFVGTPCVLLALAGCSWRGSSASASNGAGQQAASARGRGTLAGDLASPLPDTARSTTAIRETRIPARLDRIPPVGDQVSDAERRIIPRAWPPRPHVGLAARRAAVVHHRLREHRRSHRAGTEVSRARRVGAVQIFTASSG
jgi:hypothetical protein